MGRRQRTRAKLQPQELWEALLDQYRKLPGNIARAAVAVHTTYETAQKYWLIGCPHVGLGPIKPVVEGEMAIARAQREQEAKLREPEVVQLVVTDAQRTRMKLAKLCEAARDLTMAGFAVTADQFRAVQALTGQITRDLRAIGGIPADQKTGAPAVPPQPWVEVEQVMAGGAWVTTKRRRVQPRELLELQALVATVTNKLVRAAMSALQMERLHLGLPTQIVGVENMTLEEAVREIETAAAELQQTKERTPELFLVQGGKTA